MRLSRLLLITPLLSAIQVLALPAPAETIEASRLVFERGLWNSIGKWLGLAHDDVGAADLGRMECESDPGWRKTGWCSKPGRGFPHDGGATPNPLDPQGMPAVPNHLSDWNPPNTDPSDWGPLTPEPAPAPPPPPVPEPAPAPAPGPIKGSGPDGVLDAMVPENTLGDVRVKGHTGGGKTVPNDPKLGGVEYVLPDGSVYKSPPGYRRDWTSADRMAFYNRICITDALAGAAGEAPPKAPLLDDAGLEACDEIEGDIYDEIDEMEEAREMGESAQAALSNPMAAYGGGDYLKSEINNWQNRPGFGNPEDSPNDVMMSGGLGPEEDAASLNTIDFIHGSPRWKRGYRRFERKLRQWMRRRNANGFFDPESTKGINYAFGLENDPILRGPGPDDDPSLTRLTAEEKMQAGIEAITSLPFVPLILPTNYTWTPATRAEFGDNWERVKKFAQLMGRDPLQKAIPQPTAVFKMPFGTPGRDFTTRLLSFYSMQGTMVTPQIYANFHWRTTEWLKNGKPKSWDCPWWVRDMYLQPAKKTFLTIFPKKSHGPITLFGIIGAVWGIIQGVHSQHEKHMDEIGAAHQKWDEPIKEGFGPWVLTESSYTTTIAGTAQVTTVTGYTQYYPASAEGFSPSEVAELLGVTVMTTATAGGGMTTMTALPAVMTPAAAEYVGILRLAPSTVYVPVTATMTGQLSPTPQTPVLDYVEPDRLLLGNSSASTGDHDEVDGPHPPILTSESGAPFVRPAHGPRPSHKLPVGCTNSTYTNGTARPQTSMSGETFDPRNSTSGRPDRLNSTAVTLPKAPHNGSTFGPHGFPNGTSSLRGHGFSNGTYAEVNGTNGSRLGTHGYGNSTSGRHDRPNYLRGTAPWDGVVVPVISDVAPLADGRWMCSWIPNAP